MIQIGRTGGEPVGLQAKFLKNGDIKITEGPPVPALSLEPVMVSALQPAARYHDGQVPAGVRAMIGLMFPMPLPNITTVESSRGRSSESLVFLRRSRNPANCLV